VKALLAPLLALLLAQPLLAGGTLARHAAFPSTHVAPREVLVWVPEECTGKARCPVVYMADGQNLFEPGKSYGGEEWGADEAMTARKGQKAILVGVSNTGLRWQEYMPQKVFERLPADVQAKAQKIGGPPVSDAYLKFLVTELKPFIDKSYQTKSGRQSTFVMGSSMGGLISLYALAEYPETFAAAAGLSTHWPLATPGDVSPEQVAAAFDGWLKTRPAKGRLYTDRGDQALDASYAPYAAAMAPVLARHGWSGASLEDRLFPGTAHNEAAWRARLAIPLGFLLGE